MKVGAVVAVFAGLTLAAIALWRILDRAEGWEDGHQPRPRRVRGARAWVLGTTLLATWFGVSLVGSWLAVRLPSSWQHGGGRLEQPAPPWLWQFGLVVAVAGCLASVVTALSAPVLTEAPNQARPGRIEELVTPVMTVANGVAAGVAYGAATASELRAAPFTITAVLAGFAFCQRRGWFGL